MQQSDLGLILYIKNTAKSEFLDQLLLRELVALNTYCTSEEHIVRALALIDYHSDTRLPAGLY